MQARTLREIREAAGKTQETAGKALDITKQAYGRKECGKRPLGADEALILASLFKVTEAEILRAVRVPVTVTREAREEE